MNKELRALLTMAQGELSQNEFARLCGISSSSLTRIKENQKPNPDLLRKIAACTDGNPTYEELMIAAGYLPQESEPRPQIPEEFRVMARKTGNLSEEQRKRVYAMLDKTIDDVLALLDAEDNT